ncbi:MAG: hypothetical protein U9Q03_03560 [Patescibacteria group bacterium]|nr:hypothetical protein [Patescibacteria group bacterium]
MDSVIQFVVSHWWGILIVAVSLFWSVPTMFVGGKLHLKKWGEYRMGKRKGGFIKRFADYGFGWILGLIWPLTIALVIRKSKKDA